MNSPVIAAEAERRTGYTRPARPSPARPAARLDITVLLVDDDIPTRRTMAFLLRRCVGLDPLLRVHCLEGSSGADALALASDTSTPKVQFVFLDYHMPDMTGLDCLAELLRRRPALPVTLLTGNDHNALAIEAIRRGAYDILIKPDATQDLLNRTLWKGLAWAGLKEQLQTQKAQLAQRDLRTTRQQ